MHVLRRGCSCPSSCCRTCVVRIGDFIRRRAVPSRPPGRATGRSRLQLVIMAAIAVIARRWPLDCSAGSEAMSGTGCGCGDRGVVHERRGRPRSRQLRAARRPGAQARLALRALLAVLRPGRRNRAHAVRRSLHARLLARHGGRSCSSAAGWMFVLRPGIPPYARRTVLGSVYFAACWCWSARWSAAARGSGSSPGSDTSHALMFLPGRWRLAGRCGRGGARRDVPDRRAASARQRAAVSPAAWCSSRSTSGSAGAHLLRRCRRSRTQRGSDHRRVERDQPAAAGDDGRERRAACAAAGAGPGGRRARRAAAAGPGDPRHPRAGADRHRHPAPGRRAAAVRPGRLAPPRRQRDRAGPGEPVEARRSVHALAARGAGDGAAARGAGRRGRAVVGADGRRRRVVDHHRHAPAAARRRSRSRCCGPRRRRWPTSPSTRRPPGSG